MSTQLGETPCQSQAYRLKFISLIRQLKRENHFFQRQNTEIEPGFANLTIRLGDVAVLKWIGNE